jgi:hypothetical protein
MTEEAFSSYSVDKAKGRSNRKVGAALGIGILVLPWAFVWLLLRQGYSTSARLIGFGWFAATVLFVIIGGSQADNSAGTQTSTASAAGPATLAAPSAEVAPDQGPKLTASQRNAARTAKQYLSMSGFSRGGLIHQLSSSAEGYDEADATAAVDSLVVDWNENAAKSAKQYLSMSGFSCSGLIRQLSSSAEKYTESEAAYGAQQAGACS